MMRFFAGMILVACIISCNTTDQKLPILGNPEIDGVDTSFPIIADFSFTDQDSGTVTNQSFADKIYVADFIFLSCPSICPKMTKEMYKAYLPYATDGRVAFISHTIDPRHDTIPRLNAYAAKLGVPSKKWHFVTGNADSIQRIANESYFAAAYPDSTSPGGFTHSGGLLLVDKNRHIRGVYDGTQPIETERLIGDIQKLLKEQF